MTDELMGNSNDVDRTDERGSFRPSRRTVLAAAAWSVPVIVVANAAPAVAQTVVTSSPVNINWASSKACKLPGNSWSQPVNYCLNKGYVLWALFENRGQNTVTLTSIDKMVLGAVSGVGGTEQCIIDVTRPDVDSATCLNNYIKFRPRTTLPYIGSNSVQIPSGASVWVAIWSNANADSQNDNIDVTFTYNAGAGDATTVASGSLSGDPWTGTNPNGSITGGCTPPTVNKCTRPPTAAGTACSSCA